MMDFLGKKESRVTRVLVTSGKQAGLGRTGWSRLGSRKSPLPGKWAETQKTDTVRERSCAWGQWLSLRMRGPQRDVRIL